MDISFQIQGQWKTDIVLCFAWEKEGVDDACHFVQGVAPWVGISPAWRDFHGKDSEHIVLYGPPAMEVSRIMAIGLGKEKEAKAETFRLAFAKALSACKEMGLEHIGIDIVSLRRVCNNFSYDTEKAVQEITVAAKLAMYTYDRFKEKKDDDEKDTKNQIRKISFLLDDAHCKDSIRDAARMGEAESEGICLARDLANSPSNLLTPVIFADEAEKIAQKYAFNCTILKREDIEAENMGAFLAVTKASHQEPRFVVLEYNPADASKESKENPHVIIGKGITFDTGGISLKPSAGMEEMKCDMSGAAAILGTFKTLGELAQLGNAPKHRIIGLIPLAENMPGGNAIKPGDLVYTKKGKTVEIINTDAEGRLILIDALTYAQEKYSPKYIIDIATLTGACVVALGTDAAGIFSHDEELVKRVENAGKNLFERVWHMPLWESLLKDLKSNVADLSNAGSRYGGAISAAVFLKQFVDEDRRWMHIDMAGADNAENALNTKGGTGFGVRILTDFLYMD